MFFSAKDVETGACVPPWAAASAAAPSRPKGYVCPSCEVRVILREGPKRRAHFSHLPCRAGGIESSCRRFTPQSQGEGDLHKEVKFLVHDALDVQGMTLGFTTTLGCGCPGSGTVAVPSGGKGIVEYTAPDKSWRTDVGVVDSRSAPIALIEVKDTHKTSEDTSRNQVPWFEVDAAAALKTLTKACRAGVRAVELTCVRDRAGTLCAPCVRRKRRPCVGCKQWMDQALLRRMTCVTEQFQWDYVCAACSGTCPGCQALMSRTDKGHPTPNCKHCTMEVEELQTNIDVVVAKGTRFPLQDLISLDVAYAGNRTVFVGLFPKGASEELHSRSRSLVRSPPAARVRGFREDRPSFLVVRPDALPVPQASGVIWWLKNPPAKPVQTKSLERLPMCNPTLPTPPTDVEKYLPLYKPVSLRQQPQPGRFSAGVLALPEQEVLRKQWRAAVATVLDRWHKAHLRWQLVRTHWRAWNLSLATQIRRRIQVRPSVEEYTRASFMWSLRKWAPDPWEPFVPSAMETPNTDLLDELNGCCLDPRHKMRQWFSTAWRLEMARRSSETSAAKAAAEAKLAARKEEERIQREKEEAEAAWEQKLHELSVQDYVDCLENRSLRVYIKPCAYEASQARTAAMRDIRMRWDPQKRRWWTDDPWKVVQCNPWWIEDEACYEAAERVVNRANRPCKRWRSREPTFEE